MNESRSLAWQLALTADSTAGRLFPRTASGIWVYSQSCWNDPTRERTYILLTNRTHTRKLPFVNINSVRRQFHTLAAGALAAAKSAHGFHPGNER